MGSTLVRQSLGSSGGGDDDKIYFFFTERSQEQATSGGRSRVARVARVCKVSANSTRNPLLVEEQSLSPMNGL